MKDKSFDCVAMKDRIQQEILREWQSLPSADRRRRADQTITSDPLLSRFWNSRRQAGRAAEERRSA